MRLPEDFTGSMKELLGGDYDDFIASYDSKSISSIRINTSKISAGEFERCAPFPIEPIPFVSGGYYTDDTDAWSKHPYYFAGLYYMQEASAMLPALMLPVDDTDTVCDLCAAPGGKSTQLAQKARLLISNDISRSRCIPLVKNLEKNGTGNFLVSCESPQKLAAIYKGLMDKVLVDAPCSGQGMFRKDPDLISSYMKKGPASFRADQEDILEAAYEMTKPGGMIMYSTCTFSDIEDEEVILSFTGRHADMRVVDISDRYEGFTGPYDKYSGQPQLKGCTHIFPHRVKGEGHFMALMQKEGSGRPAPMRAANRLLSFDKLPESTGRFLKSFRGDTLEKLKDSAYIISSDGLITMLGSEGAAFYDRSIRYARTGTCIGRLGRSQNFTVHTALALSVKAADHVNAVDLRADDENLYRYLRGETMTDTGAHPDKGPVLICVEGFPLGFALYDGVRYKNLYEKGWRLI